MDGYLISEEVYYQYYGGSIDSMPLEVQPTLNYSLQLAIDIDVLLAIFLPELARNSLMSIWT